MTSNTVDYYEKFHSYLVELMQSYSKLGELLKKKLQAIADFDIKTLDDIIKEEQVFVLLSRGFDSNIQMYRNKLSLSGDSLSEVIKEMPDDQKPRFQQVFTPFKAKLDEVKMLNGKCQSLMEGRIYAIERSIHQLDKSNTTSYKPGAVKPTAVSDSHILKKSI